MLRELLQLFIEMLENLFDPTIINREIKKQKTSMQSKQYKQINNKQYNPQHLNYSTTLNSTANINKCINNGIKNNDYYIQKTLMTSTEIRFQKILKQITDKYDLIIVPQVQLQRIFKVVNHNNMSAFNKIKAKSIDFAIVDSDYQYRLFIELDDYTHKYQNRIERDSFVNELFKTNNLNLKRIPVKYNYDINYIENIIKEVA